MKIHGSVVSLSFFFFFRRINKKKMYAIHFFEMLVLFKTDELKKTYTILGGRTDGWTCRIGCKGNR